jgi:non-specific serine/threonine protein kinase
MLPQPTPERQPPPDDRRTPGRPAPPSPPGGGPDPAPSGRARAQLPAPLTSFVGREAERAALARLLTAAPPAGARLLTLTGPGGCGKTRLALAVSADLAASFADGVAWVDLAALTDPGLVPQAVAAALGLREEAGGSLIDVLRVTLQARRLLLALDNCEHLVAACAALAETLLHACPSLRILATSREALALAGETIRRVPSLAVPPPDRSPTVEEVGGAEAAQLFVERAAAVLPTFAVTPVTAPLLAQLCRRLDGLPLALELAAARLRVLTLEQIVQRLDDRFRLLTGGSRTALPRQRTLQATIDWSYDLLTEAERALLRRLAVFAGGCTLGAAEAVCAGDGIEVVAVLDLLTALVDKSLVQVEERGGEARYRLLETVRQYAWERLADAGREQAAVQRRHVAWCLALAEETDPARAAGGADDEAGRARLDGEQDNLRAALAWCLASDAETGLRLAASLGDQWAAGFGPSEARRWLDALLRATGAGAARRTVWRARALLEAGRVTRAQGDLITTRAHLDESLALSRELGETALVAQVLNNLGLLLMYQGDYREARAALDEGLALSRQVNDHGRVGGALITLGRLVAREGDVVRAQALFEESLSLMRTIGSRAGVALALLQLGMVARDQGEIARAEALLTESLALAWEVHAWGIVTAALLFLGDLARDQQGDPERAARHYEQGRAVAREHEYQHAIVWHSVALGWAAHRRGDADAALAFLEEGLALARAMGDRSTSAMAWYVLGLVAWSRGDGGRATALVRESLALRQALGERRGVAECLEALASIQAGRRPPTVEDGDGHPAPGTARAAHSRAVRLLGAAAALREAAGAPLWPADQPGYEGMVAATRTSLGAAAFTATWAAGRALTLEQAVAEALGGDIAESSPSVSPSVTPEPVALPSLSPVASPSRLPRAAEAPSLGLGALTPRELAVLRLIAAGRSSQEAAAELALSARTVERHITNLYGKLGLRNRAEATVYALRHGLA